MIVDCFPFFNEFALLEARLHELAPIVDKFVICEGTLTFSGKPKPLWLHENQACYKPFTNKIIHVIMDDYSKTNTTDSWVMEHAQKQLALDRALRIMTPGDTLIYTDCDEIPKVDAIQAFIASKLPIATLEMPLYYYYLNCLVSKQWRMAKILKWDGTSLLHRKIRRRKHIGIPNAGWHFSFIGDIKTKLDAYAHTEYACPPWNTPEYIEGQVRKREDLFGRKYTLTTLQDLSYLPQYIQDHMDRYRSYICE